MPEGGWFLEIEGSPQEIAPLASLLGLKNKQREEKSYRKLIRKSFIRLTPGDFNAEALDRRR